jgi:hypothetical protein
MNTNNARYSVLIVLISCEYIYIYVQKVPEQQLFRYCSFMKRNQIRCGAYWNFICAWFKARCLLPERSCSSWCSIIKNTPLASWNFCSSLFRVAKHGFAPVIQKHMSTDTVDEHGIFLVFFLALLLDFRHLNMIMAGELNLDETENDENNEFAAVDSEQSTPFQGTEPLSAADGLPLHSLCYL